MVDEREQFIYVNETAETMFGVGPGGLVGHNLSEFTNSDDFEIVVNQTSMRRQGEKGSYDYSIVRADGVRRIIRVFATPRTNEKGKYTGAFGVFTDVTEQRKAEDELRESEEKFAKIFSANPEPVILVSLNKGILLEVNESFLQATGYTRDEVMRQSMHALGLLCNKRDLVILRDTIRSEGSIRNYECWFKKKSGILGIALISSEIVTVGGADMILSVVKDITERRRSEDRVRNSLHEKEVMLKEIHHRVKNNLQVISSLLHLQSISVTDVRMLEFLKESQSRVKSMAMIHEKLYQSQDLAHVDFGDYLKSLASSLLRTYGGGDIALDVQATGAYFSIDNAIPCGLIVNELVSNSIKYAFVAPNVAVGYKKCITVKIENTSVGDLLLIVGDNGVGIPEELDIESSPTLGLRLVWILTKQINGTLAIDRRSGTLFSIRIPHLDDRKSRL